MNYHYDYQAIQEPGIRGKPRNKRTVWQIATEGFSEAHFAVFPKALVRPCILAGAELGDQVLDPFFGVGTVGLVCQELGRRCTGIEISEEYAKLARKRLGI
jgi:DNA modification methylase